MARNANNSSSSRKSRVSRVSAAPAPRQTHYQLQRARRQRWIKIICAFLVLAMLAPVLISTFLV